MLWTKFGSNFTFKFYIQNLLLQQFLWVYENYWYLWFIFLVFQKIKSQKTIPQEETPPKNKRLVLVLFKNRSLLYKKKTKLDIITASSFFSVINYLRIWLISNWYVIFILDSLDNFIVDDDDMSSSENEADFYITTNTVFTTPHRYWQLPVVTERFLDSRLCLYYY